VSPTAAVDLRTAIIEVLRNAERLTDDARLFSDMERSASCYALCILAQEEYAKAFLLHLVDQGAIPWTAEVRRLLHDHSSKQLLAMMMDFLEPDVDDFLAWLQERSKANNPIPSHVADAMNILRYEKVSRDGEWSWVSDEDPPCNPEARKIADGKVDKRKQDALYVRIGRNGQVVSNPETVTLADSRAELERTERLGRVLFKTGETHAPLNSVEYQKIFYTFKVMFRLCTV
jgi:AbiV family abortive infection protein